VDKKSVSKEVGACYRGYIIQQAGYQEVPYSLSRENYLRNIPHYSVCAKSRPNNGSIPYGQHMGTIIRESSVVAGAKQRRVRFLLILLSSFSLRRAKRPLKRITRRSLFI
jgi:hypothetical protein